MACATSLKHDGELVELRESHQVRGCTHLGTTILPIDDPDNERLRHNMLIEARNMAGEIGADAIVLKGQPDINGQLIWLYICRK